MSDLKVLYGFRMLKCARSFLNRRKWMIVFCVWSVLVLTEIRRTFSTARNTVIDINDTELSMYNDDFAMIDKGEDLKYYPDKDKNNFPLSVLPNPYLIRNEGVCKNNPGLQIIAVVTTAVPNFSLRQNIRNTWGNPSHYKPNVVRVIFVLGKPGVDWLQRKIHSENAKYQDIVQGNFLDTYRNLTHKSVLGVRWVMDHCLDAQLVVKVDDDVVVNMFEILHISKRNNIYNKTLSEILCHRRPKGKSRILRNINNKWMVDRDYFSNCVFYPFPYCDGMFAVITPSAIPLLFETAKHMPYFWIEDVYLTGILPNECKEITLKNLAGVITVEDGGLDCLELYEADCYIIAALSSTPSNIRRVWAYILEYFA